MVKKYFFVFAGCISLVLLLTGCDRNNKCVNYSKAPVTQIEGPHSGLVNQEINLTLSFNFINGCGQYGKIEQYSQGDTTTISVVAKYGGCVCTDVIVPAHIVYAFKAVKSGTYYLNFWQAEDNYLIDSLTIQ